MSTTLLQLCTDALEGVDGFNVPTVIYGNSDETAVLLKSLAAKVGRELVREAKWQALKTEYSFNTVASTSAYSLPTDFQRFSNLTFWNTSEGRQLIGPMNGPDWASLTRGISVQGFRYYFHVSGNYLRLTPTPTSAQSIGLDYYSRYFCTTSGGTAQENWTADSNLWRLDPDLGALGIRYRFLSRKGLPFSEEKADYVAALSALQDDDLPKPLIDVSGVPRIFLNGIPDGNWG